MAEGLLTSSGPGVTRALGRIFGKTAEPGDALYLVGELGAGKTCFAQGVAEGLDVAAGTPVTSPSYTLLNPYPGRLELFHFDLYRLGDVTELEEIGFDDCLYGQGVTLVEWLDRFPELQPDGVYLQLCYARADAERLLKFSTRGQAAEAWLQRAEAVWGQFELPEGGIS